MIDFLNAGIACTYTIASVVNSVSLASLQTLTTAVASAFASLANLFSSLTSSTGLQAAAASIYGKGATVIGLCLSNPLATGGIIVGTICLIGIAILFCKNCLAGWQKIGPGEWKNGNITFKIG